MAKSADSLGCPWDLFADPRFPLPETVIPSAAVDEEIHGSGVTPLDKKD